MKKIICSLLTIAMLISIVPFTVSAETSGDFKYTVNDDNTITITGATSKNVTELVIPDEIDGKPVTAIADQAFYYSYSKLESITIGNNVESIGEWSLAYCPALKSVTLPDSMKTISAYAFNSSAKLESIDFGNGVESIGDWAFTGCKALAELTLPDSVTTVGQQAFSNCTGLKTITIGNGAQRLGQAVFMGCTALENIDFGTSLKTLPQQMFYNCDSLKSVTIPDTVTFVDANAFYMCDALEEITLGKGIENLACFFIYGCPNFRYIHIPSLEEYLEINFEINPSGNPYTLCIDGKPLSTIVIPDTVTVIPDNSFYNCAGLETLIVPGNVTEIPQMAFDECSNLKEIKIDKALGNIHQFAFTNCKAITDIYFTGTEEEWMALAQYNRNLANATLHFEASIMPTPVPTFVPLTEATVVKTETETTWTFDVEIEGGTENRYAYAAVYDTDGRLSGLKKVKLSETSSIDVAKTQTDATAQILVWTDTAQPVTSVESFELN